MEPKALQTLMRYHDWATDKVLRVAAEVEASDLSKPSGLSQGTVFAVFTHVLNAERIWRSRCQHGTTPSDLFTESFMDMATLRSVWQDERDAMLRYIETLTRGNLETPITYTLLSGTTHTNRVWEILMQVVNHSTHHRSEVTGVLRGLGHSPGNTDLIVYLMQRETR